jgi:hypothetical protein
MGCAAGSATHLDGGRAAGTHRLPDPDRKFTNRFDDVFRSDAIEIIRTPFRAPQVNDFFRILSRRREKYYRVAC